VVYFALAAFLFKIRKSETAGKSAPNRILQHVYRCAITLPVTLIIPFTMVSSRTTGVYSFWVSNQYVVITTVVISLIIYFLFELITTKKLLNLLKAVPLLLLIAAVDFVFGYSVILTQNSVFNIRRARPKSNRSVLKVWAIIYFTTITTIIL